MTGAAASLIAYAQTVAGSATLVGGDQVILSWSSIGAIAAVIALGAGLAATYLRVSILSAVEDRMRERFMLREVLDEKFARLERAVTRSQSPEQIDRLQRLILELESAVAKRTQ